MRSRDIPPLASRTRENARKLRTESTDAEQKIWFQLRSGRLGGWKFRRQHPIPPYIADFVCLEACMVVELDGSQHGVEPDRIRAAYIESRGFRILRFWDNEVLGEMDAVLAAIWNALNGDDAGPGTLTPTPLPRGEGL